MIMHRTTNVKTVLFIDQELESHALICRMLGDKYPVLTASSRGRAVCTARKGLPSVIILNMALHQAAEDWQIVRDLLKDPQTCHIPILILARSEIRQRLKCVLMNLKRASGGLPVRRVRRDHLFEEIEQSILAQDFDSDIT